MFSECISYQAKLTPDAIALEMPQGTITFGRFAEDVERMAGALQPHMPRSRSIVLICDSRPYIHWLATLALDRLGHTSVSHDFNDHAFTVIGPDVVLTETEQYAGRAPSSVLIDTAFTTQVLSNPAATYERVPASPDDVVRIVLTSGTTGTPKPVALTRRLTDFRIMSTLSIHRPSLTRVLIHFGLDSAAFMGAPTVWNAGGTVLFGGRIGLADALRTLRPTMLALGPAHLQHLLDTLPADYRLDHPLQIVFAGGALPAPLHDRVSARLTDKIWSTYGSTESGMIVDTPLSAMPRGSGATGYVLPWAEVEIVDDEGRAMPPGRTGRVRVRTPDMIHHYWGRRTADDSHLFDGTWIELGDLAFLDEAGLLHVQGRADDVLDVAGEKIAATVIENRLLALGGIRDACAFVRPDADGLPLLCAVIVAEGTAGDFEAKYRQALGTGIRLHIVDALPRNAFGKLERAKVRALADINGST